MENSIKLPANEIMTIAMTQFGNKIETKKRLGLYNNMLSEFKKGQIGYSTIGLLGQSCIASIAVMSVLMNNLTTTSKMILVFLVTILCMAYNGSVLAQLKPKITFNLLISSVVFSSVVIITNLF